MLVFKNKQTNRQKHNQTKFMYISSFKYSIIYSTSEAYGNTYMYFHLPEQAWYTTVLCLKLYLPHTSGLFTYN